MSFNRLTPTPSKVLFIDEAYLKEMTEVDANVDPKMIRFSIQVNQDKYILPILGNNIFQEMKQQIASGVTYSGNASAYLSTNYIYILETWIQPILACATMMELVYKLNIQFRNKGAMQAHGEFSTNATDKQIDWLSENYRETAAFYAQRLTQFLRANPDVFLNYLNPQLGTDGNGADLLYPQKTKYFCGVHLPGLNSNNPAVDGPYVGYGMSLLQRMEYLNDY